MITRKEANSELQRRCNGLKNPNHVLEVALQMQKEIFNSLEAQLNTEQLTCDGCVSEHNTQSYYCSTCERLPRHDYFKAKGTK